MLRSHARLPLTTSVCLVLSGVLAAFCPTARADVKLPAIIGNNMVLQRAIDVPIWGWADPGEAVTVELGKQSKKVTADADGRWMVRLDSMTEGGPATMTVGGKNSLTIENILIGEVWVCSGQSNMGFQVRSVVNAEKDIALADHPEIRLFTVPRVGTQEPQYDCQGTWVVCTPETAPNFSAVGYFFGRDVHREIKMPVGLINTSWGGSACEAWVRRDLLEADPTYTDHLAASDERCAAYEDNLAAWQKKADAVKAEGEKAPSKPRDPRNDQHRPGNLYNGMILPILPYAIRGAIWYQGESNTRRAYNYRDLFPKMIDNWRADWAQGDFPFYFVQLANFQAVNPEPGESSWAELREAQSMTLSLANTGQAVIIDIGEADDIHPRNKQDVGARLALWALAKDYGRKLVYSGPIYQSMKKQDGSIILGFDPVGGGLVAKDGGPLKGFAVAGEDRKFVWAEAKIDGEKIIVSSPEVPQPVAVRYAWATNPVCNLYNAEQLPASPFRTDQWPGLTEP